MGMSSLMLSLLVSAAIVLHVVNADRIAGYNTKTSVTGEVRKRPRVVGMS